MKERMKVIVIFIIISVLSCVSLFMMYQEKNDFEQQYFHLADLQNIQNDSLGQLLDQDNILERLNNFKQELKESEKFTFIEFLPNVVEFIGEWDKPNQLVNGYEYGADLKNQTVHVNNKELLITPINCISMDQDAWDLYDLSLSEGNEFAGTDYSLTEKKLPLILGSEFKEYYDIGDEIPLLYFYEEWTGVVQGFLEDDEVIKQDWTEYSLDTRILVPSFKEVSDEIGEELQKRITYAQLDAYVLLEDKSEYSKVNREIKKLSQKYNLPYGLLRGY
ncbi:hypothetical protein [Turicibacter sp. TS3]|uniref:hypothetical protein n=1 Tax=Turicibacter sp. TS3 TaxID=2304578 RepID=UPI001379577E|nr:hypothetical protein [Turicibacter sp. TS3]NCE78336.1 hypothetical protein [Turicibacter sp. TS3]